MDSNTAIFRVQIPAPPLKPLIVSRETLRYFVTAIGLIVSAYWRGVLDRTIWAFGWRSRWQARPALLVRLEAYQAPDVPYLILEQRLRGTLSSSPSLDPVDADPPVSPERPEPPAEPPPGWLEMFYFFVFTLIVVILNVFNGW